MIDNIINRIAGNKKTHFWLFFAILVFLTVAMMFCYQPLCPGQDFFFHFRRFQALMDGLKESPFLIYLDYTAIDGYGYFAKAFYPDVILIPFAIIGNLTNAEFGYLSMIFVMTVLCGVFTYITINKIFRSPFAAAMGAILFTFCVYRLLDIYHRTALGEALSFTFIPLVFWGLHEIISGNYKKWYILAIGYALLIFTHVISTVLMFFTMLILLVIYYKPLIKEPKRILYLIIAGVAALIMACYYLLPMFEQMASDTFYYNGRNMMAKAGDMTLDFHWILWGMFTGIIHPKQLFIPGTGLLLTCVIALRIFVAGKSPQLKYADVGVVIGLIFLLMCSPVIPWSVFPFTLLDFIQMPWRLYEFSSFFFAVAGGYYLSLLVKSNKRALVCGGMVVMATLLVLVNDGKLYKDVRCSNSIESTDNNIPLPPNGYHMGGLEYLPASVPSPDFFVERSMVVLHKHPKTGITSLKREGNATTFDLDIIEPDILELPLVYYKGYKVTIDGKEASIKESPNGLIEMKADRPGKVEAYYSGTPLQVISWLISITSILALCIYIYISNRKTKNTLTEK
ncbi:hypothetical protein GGR21_003507 [Dysgonomonas hofstadii]|uniref:Membrane protein 6-pyruvoyl-tetrahydropterin synthase-related domain-containing protein n=1 Tax=Dysgonomonas hofstadii TaxID=637886 RepID=A0A840CNC3_9BACT|nr:YfhO family protein [Dysgonomonas hofstadii]MBB4037587.1 hypothetical protein [Dysgonomonas hofstadii]